MKKYCYYEGDILESEKVGLPLDDLAITRGYAAFDFFRIYNKVPFYFSEHYKRLVKSSETLGVEIGITEDEMRDILAKLCDVNECYDAQVKIIVTGGSAEDGITPGQSRLIITFADLIKIPDENFENGVKMITDEYLRFLPEAKTTVYANAVMLQKKKREQGATEILYVCEGKVSEASTSNIGIIKGGVMVTPHDNILRGLTMKVVVDLAKKDGIKVEEREITLDELLSADEVFLMATNKRVLPVVKVDDHIISDGKVGETSRRLLALYNEHIQEYCYR